MATTHSGESGAPKTLAEILVPIAAASAEHFAEIDRFRESFEAEEGETDLTRSYTTMLPVSQQEWLLRHEPKRYYDGCPPFYRAYLREVCRQKSAVGRLDDVPGGIISLYLTRQIDD